MIVRHTVGLTDPLTDADIADADRVDDGLPQSLESCIRAYGLSYFKIKLWGESAKDCERVRRIALVIAANTGGDFHFTLDGNENFKAVEPFRQFWTSLTADPALGTFLRGLLFVEQPFHRAVAMDEAAMREFAAWIERPPTIIDESDATLTSLPRAGLGIRRHEPQKLQGDHQRDRQCLLVSPSPPRRPLTAIYFKRRGFNQRRPRRVDAGFVRGGQPGDWSRRAEWASLFQGFKHVPPRRAASGAGGARRFVPSTRRRVCRGKNRARGDGYWQRGRSCLWRRGAIRSNALHACRPMDV